MVDVMCAKSETSSTPKVDIFFRLKHCEYNVIIVPFVMGTHQDDPEGGGALFALAHFRVLCFIVNHFASSLFLSITDETHIAGPPLIVSYEHVQTKLHAIGLFIQLYKCVTWSPFGLLSDFNTPSSLPPH